MGRVSVNSPRAVAVMDALIPWLVRTGSVNALCELLNGNIAEADTAALYPNRIHSLLSSDSSRSINESTLQQCEAALAALDNGTITTPSASELRKEVHRRRLKLGQSETQIATDLAISDAVVGYLLGTGETNPIATAEIAVARKIPDWSYQDVAVSRCTTLLRANRGAKIGLVIPTGGGKTRVALRIALNLLSADPDPSSEVIWITHRKTLYGQARRELQKMLSAGGGDLPNDAFELLSNRISFVMLSQLTKALDEKTVNLVVVDEAHHAAAPSYEPIFEARRALTGLFLTATPNRTDKLPIGVDSIAFNITYKELGDRGAIVLPQFEDFPVKDFQWSPNDVKDLADYLVARTAQDFTKVLVLAPRVSRVEEFYLALRAAHEREDFHPLEASDIGFVHAGGNSLSIQQNGKTRKATTDEFLAQFGAKPRAIIVSSQILLEGFDDPAINAVVITYPSTSMIVLLQAAGRCVRYTPEKQNAFVLQARNDSLAYHFDHRWLYQEISDLLKPVLLDYEYADHTQLLAQVSSLMDSYLVQEPYRSSTMAGVGRLKAGDRCRVLIFGLPYYGERGRFKSEALHGAILETSDNAEELVTVFNSFCGIGAGLSDPTDFLSQVGGRLGIGQDFSEGSKWRGYVDLLTAMNFASREIAGTRNDGSRPYKMGGATTWISYATFTHGFTLSPALEAFLEDCFNKGDVIQQLHGDYSFAGLIKLPLPLGGARAFPLDPIQWTNFRELVNRARQQLLKLDSDEQIAELEAFLNAEIALPLPLFIVKRLERFVSEQNERVLTFSLSD